MFELYLYEKNYMLLETLGLTLDLSGGIVKFNF